jgi:hypothetical protein
MLERLVENGSMMVARRRATKREVPMQFRVVVVVEEDAMMLAAKL